MDELVTVVVPVYNMCAYINRCVESIVGQTYKLLQIILVDDGSTDGSGGICDDYSAMDSRVEVIHQANGGLSAARNAGLDRVRGDWVAFVDADDYVSEYYIEDMYQATQAGCDMAICRHERVPEGSDGASPFRRASDIRHMTGYEACIRRFGREIYLFNSAWGKLYRARLWKDLRFPAGKLCEDLFVSHSLIYRSAQIAVTDAVLYAYVQTGDSIMRSGFSARHLDVLDAWQEGVRFFSEIGETELADIASRVYCRSVINALCVSMKMIPEDSGALYSLRLRSSEALGKLRHIKIYADCSRVKAITYRLKYTFGRLCPPLYGFLFMRKHYNDITEF